MDWIMSLSLSQNKQTNKKSFGVLVDPGERILITKLFSSTDYQMTFQARLAI